MSDNKKEDDVVCYPCSIVGADFEGGTVTLEMEGSDYKVSAGRYYLCKEKLSIQPTEVDAIKKMNKAIDGIEALVKDLRSGRIHG